MVEKRSPHLIEPHPSKNTALIKFKTTQISFIGGLVFAENDRAFVRRDLFDLYSSVDHVRHELASARWRLVNKREMVISGQAGISKSHPLADFRVKQLELTRPFVLVLTGTLIEADPWEQIRAQLDLGKVRTSP